MTARSKTKRSIVQAHSTAADVKNAAPTSQPHELLLMPEVTERVRLSDTTLWRLEKVGRFPKRVKIGFKRVAWRTVEIEAWIAGRWVPVAA